MPELPEVETIVRELARKLVGKKLAKFLVFDKEKISQPRLKLPIRVLGVSRRGKYIIFNLDCGRKCVVHLRMTGLLLLKKQQSSITAFADAKRKNEENMPPGQHERARLVFSDGSILHFFDTRRFGTVEWFDHIYHKWPKQGYLPRLGIEPLSQSFNEGILKGILNKSSRGIKSFLLDQQKIAGIGNIYADEVLWLAKIHPCRKSNRLTTAEAGRLALAIKKILREAIKKGGFTLRDYRRTGGESGYYQHSRKVYGREGKKCLRCKTKIRRIKIGGRSSYFCSSCQK